MIVQTQTVFTELHNVAPSGYLVRPDDERSYPGIVVIQEWWGLDPHMRDVAIKLAGQGFVVLVPDLFHGAVATEPSDAQKLAMMTFQNIQSALGEILTALKYLENNMGVRPKKLGLMGFCMGGHLAYRVAEHYPNLGALSPWYAGGYDPVAEDVAKINAPVLAIYGETDGAIPVAQVKKIESLFKASHKHAEFRIYPNAGHAFNNPDHGAGKPEAAKDAWARAVAFFKANLSDKSDKHAKSDKSEKNEK